MGGLKKRLVLLSNREPYVHEKTKTNIKCKMSVGGLVSALDSVMQSCQGTWIAWGSGNADREVCGSESKVLVPEENPRYTLKRIWLSKKEVSNYYYGFCNRILWPISHLFREKARFKKEYWRAYRNVNNKFTRSVLEEIKSGDNVWVQDFHLCLVPELLRDKGDDINIAHFWHIPFPPWEIFSTIPWRREILKGLLGCDLIGFHTSSYVDNFQDCVKREFSADIFEATGEIEWENRRVKVEAFPIGIDYDRYRALASSTEVGAHTFKLRRRIRSERIIFGIDRLDYTKGILNRLLAFERFLETNPRYRGRVVFVQVASPSRTKVWEYRMMKREIDENVGRINGRFQTPNWAPIIYIYRYIPTEELMSFYQVADIAMITPLIDGMNLVAKEYVAVKDDGVLILSEFAGASQEMKDAILVNPHDIDKTAKAITKSLNMSKAERERRIRVLREKIKNHDVHWWLNRFLEEWGVELFPVILA
jgi:trehalose 6-phosphate synthase